MSLLDQDKNYSVRDFLFIAAGLLGLFGFFMLYGDQDPRRIIDTSMDKEAVSMKAAEVANALGFNTGNYRMQVNFETDEELLDSVQVYLGRQQAISLLSEQASDNLYPYYWEVHFEQKNVEEGQQSIMFSNDGPNEETGATEFVLRFDDGGTWIELINDSDLIPERNLNRPALRNVFSSDSTLELWRSLPDSVWEGVLSFDLEQNYNDTTNSAAKSTDPHRFRRDEIVKLGAYHLRQAGWNLDYFEIADIRMETVESSVVARIRYQSSQPIHGQRVHLDASVTPMGGLLELTAEYNPQASNSGGMPSIWELGKDALTFLFFIGAAIIFYFRIRSRVIDTKSALVISIMAGFIVPVVIFLDEAQHYNLFQDGGQWTDFIGLSLIMGMTGALASVAFFVISAIGDSTTRQHWPEKLDCYDYIRQGMFFNKPVGEVLVRSVTITFLLAGFWATLLSFFPGLYLENPDPFLEYEVIWPPLYMLMDNFWYSLLIVFSIFMVVGAQAYAQTSNQWIAGGFMILAITVVNPLPITLGPTLQQFTILLILGAILTFIYLYWDFLTVLLTHFLFSGLLVVSGGWIVENSPDFYLFVCYLFFLFILTGGGILFIATGKEGQALPDYVPEYVEELAQEERIKQELQIARDVQQSFLPIKTPAIGNLDLAAVCKPAYETGGDYYDFIQLDDHRIAVAVGDVSGKGIQAAFYMTFTKGILHTLCRETESPAEVLKKANRLFYENARRGTFISLVYGIVDTRAKTFRFARAGHNPIMHYSAENKCINLLQPSGLGLGLTISQAFDDNIEETKLDLAAGDLLLLYTDGVVEALNTAHQFYGTSRLQKLIAQNIHSGSKQLLSDLVGDVTKFAERAKQHDDMTIMVIKLSEES